jgi:hypothetical protein
MDHINKKERKKESREKSILKLKAIIASIDRLVHKRE